MFIHSLLEGGQRFILHVVTAAAEPVGVGRVGVADGGVHRAVAGGPVVGVGGGALAIALGLRDHLKHPDSRLRGLSVALPLKLPIVLFLVGAALCKGVLQGENGAGVK